MGIPPVPRPKSMAKMATLLTGETLVLQVIGLPPKLPDCRPHHFVLQLPAGKL
jgi:hypothetical protein